jgi:hypothetical protein
MKKKIFHMSLDGQLDITMSILNVLFLRDLPRQFLGGMAIIKGAMIANGREENFLGLV